MHRIEEKMAEIYFVEDEPDIARAVKEYLEQKGFGVRTGNSPYIRKLYE